MRKLLLPLLVFCVVVSACTTPRRASVTRPAAAWDQRVTALQHTVAWQLDGRAAVSLGTQGWQASLDWTQNGPSSELHLAGPLGIGALTLKRTPGGLSVNGAPPSDAMLAQVHDKLGFDPPLDDLRYWLLGVPDPDAPFELTRNDQDRALHLVQSGWTIDYDRYLPVAGDVLPGHLVVSREGVRVKIAVDHWTGIQ